MRRSIQWQSGHQEQQHPKNQQHQKNQQHSDRRQTNLVPAARSRLLASVLDTTQISDTETLDYLLAVFFSREYQAKFAECLWHDAPKAFPTRDEDSFRELAKLGKQLRGLLTADPTDTGDRRPTTTGLNLPGPSSDSGTNILMSAKSGGDRRIRYMDGAIVTGAGERYLVSPEVWRFQVGTHQVARKWYRDHQHLEPAGLTTSYGAVLQLIHTTLAVQADLAEFYARRGGFSEVHCLS